MPVTIINGTTEIVHFSVYEWDNRALGRAIWHLNKNPGESWVETEDRRVFAGPDSNGWDNMTECVNVGFTKVDGFVKGTRTHDYAFVFKVRVTYEHVSCSAGLSR